MKLRRAIWLILWILSLVVISFYGGAVSYGFFFAMTLLPVISFIYLFCVFFRFKIYQEVESRDMVCAQAMPYYFLLRNEDYFGFASIQVKMFPHFSSVENVAEEIEYELLPGEEYRYDTNVTCKYRGEYEIGVKEVVVTDFFRLFQFRYSIPGTIKAIVHPRLVELEELSSLSQLSVDLQRESLWDKKIPDAVVRDYAMGDSLKRVHWKATARTRELKVRNEIGEEKQDVTFLLDTQRYSENMEQYLPLESKILETLLALGLFFAKKNTPVAVYYGQRELQKSQITNMQAFEEFYRKMSAVSFEKEENFLQMLQNLYYQASFLKSKLLIGILHHVDEEILCLAEEIAQGGTNVVLYVVTDENLENYMRDNTERKKLIAIPIQAELGGIL